MSSAVLRRIGREWLWGYTALFAVLLYLPSACIMLLSFNSGIHIKFPLDSFTFDWYRALAANDSLLAAAGNSFRVGFVAASAATVIGVLGGFGLVRYNLKGGKAITGLSIMPLLIPSIILGISLLVLLRVIGVGNSLIAITIGHVIFCTPLSVSIMISRFVDLDRTLEEAALDLGAREIATFLQITLPRTGCILRLPLVRFVPDGDPGTDPARGGSPDHVVTQLPNGLANGTDVVRNALVQLIGELQ